MVRPEELQFDPTSKMPKASRLKTDIKPESLDIDDSSNVMFTNVIKNFQTKFKCFLHSIKNMSSVSKLPCVCVFLALLYAPLAKEYSFLAFSTA